MRRKLSLFFIPKDKSSLQSNMVHKGGNKSEINTKTTPPGLRIRLLNAAFKNTVGGIRVSKKGVNIEI